MPGWNLSGGYGYGMGLGLPGMATSLKVLKSAPISIAPSSSRWRAGTASGSPPLQREAAQA